MPVNSEELQGLSVDELNDLIRKAREIKSRKATPTIKVNGYVASVGKHVEATLQAVKKLNNSEGVSAAKWQDVEKQLSRLSLDKYKAEAEKVTLTIRGGKRTRRRA